MVSYWLTILAGALILTAVIRVIPPDWDAKEWARKVLRK